MRPPNRGGRVLDVRSGNSGRTGSRFSSAGRGRGRGRGGQFRDEGPPAAIEGTLSCRVFSRDSTPLTEIGTFLHACEGEIVCKSTNKKVIARV